MCEKAKFTGVSALSERHPKARCSSCRVTKDAPPYWSIVNTHPCASAGLPVPYCSDSRAVAVSTEVGSLAEWLKREVYRVWPRAEMFPGLTINDATVSCPLLEQTRMARSTCRPTTNLRSVPAQAGTDRRKL